MTTARRRSRRWIGRALLAIGLLALAILGYAGWRYGHPTLQGDVPTLATRSTRAGDVTARYFGTTTLAFSDGRNTVMVDALLTRPSISRALFGTIASDPARIAALLRQGSVRKLDLLLVTHTHYDHALDSAAVAAQTGALVVGSPSTRQVALGGGTPADRILTVRGGETLHAGAFVITVFRSLHSLGDRVPGDVTVPLRQPAKLKDYREGGTFAYLIAHSGLRILVHASANVVPGMYRGVRADVVFLATGGLASQPAAFTQRYWREIVETTGARLVVPIHWDDFFQPLDRPLVPLRRFMDDIPLTMRRIAPLARRDHVALAYVPLIAPVDLAAAIPDDKH